jgi:protein involved in polysaccharide export with SLBB domain
MPKVVPLPSYRATVQPVTGQYLVGPDGTINLRKYGVVHTGGKTVADARIAIQNHLKQYLDSPELSVKVVAYNSHVYYVITQGPDQGDTVRRLPATGEERVSDAISLSQIKGLSQLSGKKIWIARPMPHNFGDQQILSVEWDAPAQRVRAATNYQLFPGDRVYVATPDSSPVKTLPVEKNNRADTPRNPYQSIPAHPKDGIDKQPVATVKPIPPATPVTGALTLGENQRLAKIEVWERKKGQAKVILNRPQIVFAIGQEANAEVGNKESRLEVTVRSISDDKPIQHVIELKLIRDPESKNPVTLMAPKLTLNDHQTGSVVIAEADGSELGMEAGIYVFDPRATLETPPARRAEVLPVSDQSATKEASKTESTPAPVSSLVWKPNSEEAKMIANIENLGGEVFAYQKSPGKPLTVVLQVQCKAGLETLTALPQLQFLAIYRTDVTDAELVPLEKLTQLQTLKLAFVNVTDDKLKHLSGLTNLQSLCLMNTQVTDAGVDNLKSLTNLTVLDLRETKVTDAGVKKLQQMLPKCKIIPAGTIHPSSIFPDRQSVIDPDRIYDPILTRPIPKR